MRARILRAFPHKRNFENRIADFQRIANNEIGRLENWLTGGLVKCDFCLWQKVISYQLSVIR